MQNKKQEELEEKVFFCKNCHSLHIMVDEALSDSDWDGSYCGKCNSTNIGECTIGEWLVEEERRKTLRRRLEWRR